MALPLSFPRDHRWCPRYVHLLIVLCYFNVGVGFMGAMVRHLSSLRRMGRDHGWIHTLLEDAENERMHLLFVMYEFYISSLFYFLNFNRTFPLKSTSVKTNG